MTLSLLLVDDDADFISFLKGILVDEDVRISSCANGLSALYHVEKQNFDMILLDVGLPDRQEIGTHVIARCAKDKGMVVVICSGCVDSLTTILQGDIQAADHHMYKPFPEQTLLDIVEASQQKMASSLS